MGVFERAENARKVTIGKKRRIPSDPRPTGSELEFSFEKEMESYERILYDDVNVSSKRVCMGRVVTMKNGDGVHTHVAKEIEEEEAGAKKRVLQLPAMYPKAGTEISPKYVSFCLHSFVV